MADLTTRFIGLTLKNPLIVGSSDLTGSLENLKTVETFGAGAVVLKSIFEEQIRIETQQVLNASDLGIHPEAFDALRRMAKDRGLDAYLRLIEGAKKALEIPVVASIHCVTAGEWVSFAGRVEAAGADAIELNIFHIDRILDEEADSSQIEAEYVRIAEAVKARVSVPIMLKIGFLFTHLPRMICTLGNHPAVSGLVLFNRFWTPDLDIETRRIVAADPLSHPHEIGFPLRWIGLLSNRLSCDVVASSGVNSGKDVIKLIMAGAKAVQICSALYRNGIEHLDAVIREIHAWLDAHGITSVDSLHGMMAARTQEERLVYGRMQFMKRYAPEG